MGVERECKNLAGFHTRTYNSLKPEEGTSYFDDAPFQPRSAVY